MLDLNQYFTSEQLLPIIIDQIMADADAAGVNEIDLIDDPTNLKGGFIISYCLDKLGVEKATIKDVDEMVKKLLTDRALENLITYGFIEPVFNDDGSISYRPTAEAK